MPLGVAGAGESIERRPAGIPQAEHSRRLVERFARRVVACPPDDLESSVTRHSDQVGVRAAHHESQQRRLEIGSREHPGVDVTPQVIDARQGFGPRGGQALPDADAHQQASDEARATRHREEVDVVRRGARILKRQLEEARQSLEMVPRGELRHDTTELFVQGDLGMDDVGQDLAAVLDHRDRGLVAACLNAQRQRQTVASGPSGHLPINGRGV